MKPARSRALVAAALLGAVFAASAAQAEVQDPNHPHRPAVVVQSAPPQAQPPKPAGPPPTASPPQQVQAPRPGPAPMASLPPQRPAPPQAAPQVQAAPAVTSRPAPTAPATTAAAPPRPAMNSASGSLAPQGRQGSAGGGQARQERHQRLDGTIYYSQPYNPGYDNSVVYVDPNTGYPVNQGVVYQNDPGYAPGYAPAYGGAPPNMVQGDPRYQANASLPAQDVAHLDPAIAARQFDFGGGDQLNLQEVMSTIAGARIVDIDPSLLMAFQARSIHALRVIASENDNADVAIDGPYAFTTQSWLSAVARFGPSLGLTREAASIVRDNDGQLTTSDQESFGRVMSLRTDTYVASILAAANLAGNSERYRRALGGNPSLADLLIGHHAGPDVMIRLAQVARQAPATPLADIISQQGAEKLIDYVGLSNLPVAGNVWTVGHLESFLDKALQSGMAHYAASKAAQLPADYQPLGVITSRASLAANAPQAAYRR